VYLCKIVYLCEASTLMLHPRLWSARTYPLVILDFFIFDHGF